MKTRIITAVIGLIVVLPVLLFSNTVALEILIALISLVGIYEMIRCIGQQKNLWILIPSEIIAGFMPFCIRQIDTEKVFGMTLLKFIIAVCIVYTLWVMAVSIFSKGKFPIDAAALIFMTVLYITCGFTGIICTRALEGGQYLFWLIFIASWIPDTGAYFIGVNFGKHKLIPDVSPKKSVEGAIGGVVTCMIAFAIYTVIINKCFDTSLNIWLMVIAAALLAVVSMIGDLIASLIKRHYDIKDYGKLLPGHGGIMDRFDSILAVSCVINVLWLIPVFANNVLK